MKPWHKSGRRSQCSSNSFPVMALAGLNVPSTTAATNSACLIGCTFASNNTDFRSAECLDPERPAALGRDHGGKGATRAATQAGNNAVSRVVGSKWDSREGIRIISPQQLRIVCLDITLCVQSCVPDTSFSCVGVPGYFLHYRIEHAARYLSCIFVNECPRTQEVLRFVAREFLPKARVDQLLGYCNGEKPVPLLLLKDRPLGLRVLNCVHAHC